MTAVNDGRVNGLLGSHDHPMVPKRGGPWQVVLSRFLAFADALAVAVAVTTAQWLRFGYSSGQHSPYLLVSATIAVAWMAALTINRSRSPGVVGSGTEEYRRVWAATFWLFGTVAIVSMLFKLELARGYLMMALPVGLALLLLFRWCARRVVVRARAKSDSYTDPILLVGTPSAVRDLACALAREPWAGYRVAGACITDAPADTVLKIPGMGSIPVFGDESNIIGATTATNSRAVAVTATEQLDGKGIRDLSWNLEKLEVELLVSPGVIDVAGPRLEMRPVAGLPLIHLEKPQYHGAKRFQKTLFDIAFSTTALICGLPVLAAIAVAIKLTSDGPVFYRQERIGLNGRAFEMIKFRTMVDGADRMVNELQDLNESDGGVLFKIRQDPRVTTVGQFLRKYSLDELPQFINVLRREMSVVGPRPPLASEVKTYDDFARRRLLVKPGITGLWQVSGRSDLSWEDSVRLDLFYVENWSMVSDLVIAAKTARAVLGHSGAY